MMVLLSIHGSGSHRCFLIRPQDYDCRQKDSTSRQENLIDLKSQRFAHHYLMETYKFSTGALMVNHLFALLVSIHRYLDL
jgi:hypothetical protein